MLFVCTTCEIFYTFRGKKKVWLVWLSCVLSSQISFCVYPPHSTSQAIKTELVKDTRGTLSLWLRRPCRNKWLCCGVLRQRTPAPVPFTASSLSCLLLNGSESEVQMLNSVWPGAKHLTYASQCFLYPFPGLMPGTGHCLIPLPSKTLGKLSKQDRNTSSGKLYCPNRISHTLTERKKKVSKGSIFYILIPLKGF